MLNNTVKDTACVHSTAALHATVLVIPRTRLKRVTAGFRQDSTNTHLSKTGEVL